ncbi:hypothetical protein EYF80_017457 [Liparis tanakae]|uniref:Uncharacterized protein n=1 Tax=Liparis tanakae TaxID=230148 RepID=A0A4Z2I4C5_9TELE|nr:hypothetical protein EYF80_017457 [Liparis tanakae]
MEKKKEEKKKKKREGEEICGRRLATLGLIHSRLRRVQPGLRTGGSDRIVCQTLDYELSANRLTDLGSDVTIDVHIGIVLKEQRYHPDQWRRGSVRNDDSRSRGKCFSDQHRFFPPSPNTADRSFTGTASRPRPG